MIPTRGSPRHVFLQQSEYSKRIRCLQRTCQFLCPALLLCVVVALGLLTYEKLFEHTISPTQVQIFVEPSIATKVKVVNAKDGVKALPIKKKDDFSVRGEPGVIKKSDKVVVRMTVGPAKKQVIRSSSYGSPYTDKDYLKRALEHRKGQYNYSNENYNSCGRPLNPDNGKPKWAIPTLTFAYGKAKEIDIRNNNLFQKLGKYMNKEDFTFVFFSEYDFPVNLKVLTLQTLCPIANVQFINTYDKGYYVNETVRKFGYNYMCKFYSLDMYEYLEKFGYDYYFRIDSDCIIDDNVYYNIFEQIEHLNIEYAYAVRKMETHNITSMTLPPFVQNYTTQNQIVPTNPMGDLTQPINFYNNFHLGKVSFFRRNDVQSFLNSINASDGIRKYRWGDSTIQAYAVRLFMKEEHVFALPSIAYYHKSHEISIDTGKELSSKFDPKRQMTPSDVRNNQRWYLY